MINKIICNRYKILDHLGTGGMATVWLGYDTILDRQVAIKTFKIDANDEDAVKRFNREAKAVTSLSHPNIVSIYDVENEGEFYYLILEYVEGMTLKDYMIKNPRMPIETIVHIAKQIAAGLSHAHQNGIIHRDIKPQNILMNENLTCKITDFGIARAYGDTTLTQTNQMLGTVYYLSPEQARGNVATAQSDIYSLGILIFEMITGQIPFKGESAVAIALKHLQEELPDIDKYRENVPQSVKNIVLQATMKNPNERYISSKELFEDLSTVLNPERLHENKYTGFKIPTEPVQNNNYNQTQYIDRNPIDVPHGYSDFNNYNGEDDYYDYEEDQRQNNNNNRGYQNKQYKNSYNSVSKKNDKEQTSKAKHIFFAILAMVVIIVGAFFTYNYLVGANSVSAPDVRNKTLEEAKVTIVKAGLEVGDITEVASDDVKEKTVIDSDPKAGKKVRKGSKVDLRVSSGKKTVDMPNFVGIDEENVRRNASKLGFKNITVEKVESDRYDTGKVVSQNIPAGTEIVPKEKELIIQVSSGKKKVSMPNLVGEESSRAESVIASYGFKNVSYKEEYSDKEAGTVISQSIRSGSSIIPSEESLEIIISKGKEKKTSRDDSDTDARTNNDNNSNNSSSRNTNSSTNVNNNDRRDNS
ncbi:Stk1 family PASTA domain-containing Ser/Thr kinase [Gemella haemolysans]|uniref:Stk1 family PASTA domain-containing Ser/Thr kinase n=1 Tax=Gemella haemolysans TaxID=1379 RepID=UPI0023315767|nr:Stk1 family PASTA domain-containing Ser/Thr kinase [Gemella haemolysans]MDB6213089.1 Stk1 family PASTA domain-containing Ser/Thr kinase [Gemella haemolysans]